MCCEECGKITFKLGNKLSKQYKKLQTKSKKKENFLKVIKFRVSEDKILLAVDNYD